MSTDAVGNLWPLALDLGRAYEERGVELVLVAMGRKLSNEQRRDAWGISTLTLHEQPLRVEWMDDPWDDVRQAGELLLALERRYQPDVVHVHGYAQAALPFHVPVIVSAHACVLPWWRAAHREPVPASLDVYRSRCAAGWRCAEAVVAATRSTLLELARELGPTQRPRVIPVGCDPELFLPDRKEPLILSASRSWDGVRNQMLLRQAAAEDERLAWPVLLAADDTRPPDGPLPAEAHPLGHVRNLGRLSRAALAEWLGRASIYALLGSADPSGLSVLEAALSGCALLLGETASLRELWEGAAMFVAPEDPAQVASALNELARDADGRKALANSARDRALGMSVARSAEAHLALYEELVATAPRRRAIGHRARA
jgi:glycosyltransferase involved in cell wall biosynthesis